jgi:hypothetical protein
MTKNIYRLILLIVFSSALCLSQVSYQWQKKVAGFGLGNPLTYNPSNPNTVYGSVAGGKIYVSYNRGAAWQLLTTVPGGNFIKAIVINPADSLTMLAGQELGPSADKIWKTTDGGGTWTQTFTGEFSYYGVPIEFNKNHPGIVYTMSGSELHKSTDFGSTWALVSNQGSFNPWCDAALRPDSANVMYIGDNTSGIWKTYDGGVTFKHVFTTFGEIPMIAIDEQNPAVAYATKYFGSGGGVIKTTDFGETWFNLAEFQTNNQCWGIAIDQTDHRRVVMGTYTSDPVANGIYISGDEGATWMRTACGLPTPFSLNYGLLVLDSLTVIALQEDGIYLLNRVDMTNYPRGTVSGTTRDSLSLAPIQSTVKLVQSTCDGTTEFTTVTDALGNFSFDSLYISDSILAASYRIFVDPEIPYAQETIPQVQFGAGGVDLTIPLVRADIFLVGEDSGSHDRFYRTAIESLGFRTNFWNMVTKGSAPLNRGNEFSKNTVIYYTASKQSPISQTEVDNLTGCLQSGSNLLITGQDLLERNPSASIFTDHLGIGFAGNAGILYVEGSPGDIFDGYSFFTNGTGADYPQSRDAITITGVATRPILGYGTESSLGIAAVRVDSSVGGGKVVFMGFGFETINITADRKETMRRILNYFDTPSDVSDLQIFIPSEFRLEQNYPNPFNPSTVISYSLPASDWITLKVYDVLGREVAVLVNERQDAGAKSVKWNAEGMPGGVYFYKLSADRKTSVQKMVLVK